MQLPRFGESALLRDGAAHYSGLDEAVFRNIDACVELSKITRTSMGPNGMNKMILNHLEKLFVTKDAAAIVSELEVEHAAAKILCMASQNQAFEIGDQTNLVITLGGELLAQAKELLISGITVNDIVKGYELAAEKAIQFLHDLECWKLEDFHDVVALQKAVMPAVMAKNSDDAPILARLAAEASAMVMPKDPRKFDIDCVRVAKLVGPGLHEAQVLRGMVLMRAPAGSVKSAKDALVVVYEGAVEPETPETKATVLLKSAEELMNFSKGEEERLDAQIKALHDQGVGVLVAGGSIHDLAQHYLDKYGILTIRLTSKFELKRFARSVGATSQVKFTTDFSGEASGCFGHVHEIGEIEIGGNRLTIAQSQGRKDKAERVGISTIVLRASTRNGLDDAEGAINNAVNIISVAAKNGEEGSKFVAGAGAAETELARLVSKEGDKMDGQEQFAVRAFAESLLVVPRVLSDTSGFDTRQVISRLRARHEAGESTAGINIDGENLTTSICDAAEKNVLDLMTGKEWAIRMALDATITILRVDQVILAKQSGGPNPNNRPRNPEFAKQPF